MNSIDYQLLVDQLINFVELRFGVYLDTIMGLQCNLENCKLRQQQAIARLGLTIEYLDKTCLIRGNGPPSSNLEECRKREIHRMTQGDFKNHNSPGGANYNFAIENCLSDVFNYWDTTKEKLGFKMVNDIDAFPVMRYMRKLRHRVQHDLYGERVANPDKGPIIIGKTITSYLFPAFDVGQVIRLSEKDIENLIFEIRAQIAEHLVPFINNFLTNQSLAHS